MSIQTYESLRKFHPCMSRKAGGSGRIHLPVSPSCNLSCRYCRRALTVSEERPGTALRILPVEEVKEIISKARTLCPELTTVGIAGPGEALASEHALQAFEITDREFPEMIKCMSTNGLMLYEKAEALAGVHVNSVTVTVNAVDPRIQAKINRKIFYKGSWIGGEDAARILIENQLSGIRRVTELGMTVKVNTVLIPGINDGCIGEVAAKTSEAGARICNIIPLIPQADMADLSAPGCDEIENARSEAGKHLDIFLHCQHCRADAVGQLGGKDLGREIYGGREFEQETFSHG